MRMYHGTDSSALLGVLSYGAMTNSKISGVRNPFSADHGDNFYPDAVYLTKDYEVAIHYTGLDFHFMLDYLPVVLEVEVDTSTKNIFADEDAFTGWIKDDDEWHQFMMKCYKKGLLDKYDISFDGSKYNFPNPNDIYCNMDVNVMKEYPVEKCLETFGCIAYDGEIPIAHIKSMTIYLDVDHQQTTSIITKEEFEKVKQNLLKQYTNSKKRDIINI